MAVISRAGEWYVVTLDGALLGQFVEPIDAHRCAISLLHDGLAASVELRSGLVIV